MTSRTVLMIVLFFGATSLAIFATLLILHTPNVTLSDNSAMADAFMEDVTAIIMDVQGKPKMKIVTPKMTHFSGPDRTTFETPALTLYRKSPKPWYVSALHGEASLGADQVDFWDKVIIHHPADDKTPATIVKTESLTVFPNKQTAETKDFIKLIQPNIFITAVGMFADMNSGNIQLLSKARGEYVPNS